MKQGKITKKVLALVAIAAVLFMLLAQAAFPLFAASAPNIITYEGRVLNSAGVPLTATSASMIFRLYNASSAGTCLWSNSSASCASATAMTVTLTDGLFSVNLGDTSASFAAIGDSIFADNATVYLDVTIGGETLSPRRQVVSAPYALNAENLDGYDSSQSGGTSAFVPVTDANGNLTITGNPQSTAVSGGSLYINPAAADSDETIFGVGLAGSSRFAVDEDGDLTIVGDMLVDNALDLDVDDNTGTVFTLSEGSNVYLALTTTNAAETLTLGNTVLTQLLFTTDNNADSDLTFTGGATFNDDVVISAGAAEVFEVQRTLTNATAENAMTVSVTAVDTTSSTTAQLGLLIENAASTEALDALLVLSNADADDTVTSGLSFGAGGAGIDFTYGIDLDSTEIGNADIRFENSGTLDEAAAGTWTFDRSAAGTVILVGTDDDSNTALTLNSSGTGALSLAPTGAGSVAIGTVSSTFVSFLTDNNADSDYLFAGGATFNDDVVISAGAAEVFEVLRTLTNATAENAMVVNVTASDTTGSVSTQYGILVDNLASTEALDALIALNNTDADDTVGSGLLFTSGGAGTDFTYGIDLDSADIGTADIRFENSGTLDEAAAGTWTFDRSAAGTVTLVGTDDDTNTALTVSSSGTGALSLDPTGAGSIAIGSIDVTAITLVTDNSADNDLTITGGATFNDDVVISAGAAEVFEVGRTLTNATAENAMSLTVTASDTTSSTTAQLGFLIENATSTEALDALLVLSNVDGDDTVTTGLSFGAGGAGTDFTYGIDLDSADIGTADIRFENSGTLDEAAAGTWTFDRSASGTVTLVGTDDDTNTALTVSSSGTGALTLDPTGAGTVAIGSADVTAVTITTDNNSATDLTITGGVTVSADLTTTSQSMTVSADGLTTGIGLLVERTDSATDYDAAGNTALLVVNQANDNSTSDADGLRINSMGGGSAIGLYLVQAAVNAPGANAVSQQALVIDVNEAAGDVADDEDVFTIRSDADGTPDTEFKVQLDGDVLYDGTASSPASDLAEVYPSSESLTPGDVVVLDANAPGSIKKSTTSYEGNLFGAISTKPAVRMGSDYSGYDVALSGRIPLKVSAENGAIAVGDPLTSATTSGYAMKATEPGMIVGRALQAHTSGLGMIEAFVDAQWYAGAMLTTDGSSSVVIDDIALSSIGTANVSRSFGSHLLTFRGSGWDGTNAVSVGMSMGLSVANGSAVSRISFGNADGAEVAYLSSEGNFALAGRLYPADRGTLQTSKYIYYDGSQGAAGDFMRTNASGWATGSYDFAEMFESKEALASGDVVMFASDEGGVRRSAAPYEAKLAGIVSTRPGFLAGENVAGAFPIALAGRVPTNVTNEGGAIEVGDPLTSSSTPGFAMKATEEGTIIGFALEALTGEQGSVNVFVRPGWYNGEGKEELAGTENAASQVDSLAALESLQIRSLTSLAGTWSIGEDGTFVSHLATSSGEKANVYASMSPQVTLTLSGTTTLQNGSATIHFDEIDPNFDELISDTAALRVFVSAQGPIGSLFVPHRERAGFTVVEVGGNSTGVLVDWFVVAYRDGYEPVVASFEEAPVAETPSAEAPVESIVLDPASEDVFPLDADETTDGAPATEEVLETSAPVEGVGEGSESETTSFLVDPTIEEAPLTVVEPAVVVE